MRLSFSVSASRKRAFLALCKLLERDPDKCFWSLVEDAIVQLDPADIKRLGEIAGESQTAQAPKQEVDEVPK